VSQIIRILQSAVDPADIEPVRRLFAADVQPVLQSHHRSNGNEQQISSQANASGQVEGAPQSRRENRPAQEDGLASRQVAEAQVRVFELLRQEPVVRIFEVASGS
jgi:hypothetical protein